MKGSARSQAPGLNSIVVFGVLALAVAVRVMHFSSALQSPLSYQPGPDEDYYLRFGEAVASGHGADAPEFTFMDPAARQQYPDAVRHYQRAVALRPRSSLAHYNLAKALLALERRPEALAEARIAESLHPSAEGRSLMNQAEAAR